MPILQNTLYVTSQGAYLGREGESVVVRIDGEPRLRVPLHHLAGIVCFGQVSCSPALMGTCGDRQVAISFLTERGRFLARVEGAVSGNVLLRREQYRRADDLGRSAEIARYIVVGKIANARAVLHRGIRDRPDAIGAEVLASAVNRLAGCMSSLGGRPELDLVRGIEGDAARTYFAAFDYLITAQKDDFTFRSRSRRPPLDNVNALLSFVYTLLLHDVRAALECVGLDPAVGFLHRDRPGRPGLGLDLMEEWRAPLADRLVLSLINRRQVTAAGFTRGETGEVTMDDATRKTVLTAWQERKQEEMIHPFLGERMAVALMLQTQARLFARFLRDDIECYPPVAWK